MSWADIGGNPAPGDPARLRDIAGRFTETSDQAEEAADRLRRISALLSDGMWEGDAAESFASTLRDVLPDLCKMTNSYAEASQAVRSYADSLTDAQDMADRARTSAEGAIHEHNSAAQRQTSARAEASTFRRSAKDAAVAVTFIRGQAAADPVNFPIFQQQTDLREGDRLRAQWSADSAERRAQTAATEAAAASARLEASRRLAASAQSLREGAARTASARLHEASESGIKNRSWLEQANDVVTGIVKSPEFDKFLDVVSNVAEVLLSVAPVMPWVCGAAGFLAGGPAGAAAGFMAGGRIGDLMTIAGVAMKAGVVVGRMAQASVGAGSPGKLGGSIVDLGFAGMSIKGPLPSAASRGFAGRVKRSLAYTDNRTLSGKPRKLFEHIPVAPKAADARTGSEYIDKNLTREARFLGAETGVNAYAGTEAVKDLAGPDCEDDVVKENTDTIVTGTADVVIDTLKKRH